MTNNDKIRDEKPQYDEKNSTSITIVQVKFINMNIPQVSKYYLLIEAK